MTSTADRLFDVTGRVVMVTGAASGLGRSMATVLAQAGAYVVLADCDGAAVATVADGLSAAGGTVEGVAIDVTDAVAVDAATSEVAARRGRLDVVFANAGIAAGRAFDVPGWELERFPVEAWDRGMSVNLTGVLNTLRAAAAVMRAQGRGKIVATASTAGLRADPMVAYGYGAAKAAVLNLVRHAALDLARDGVTVNAIAPGPFVTSIGGAELDPVEAASWAASVPLGRMATVDELQGLVLLLASDASSFMTGAVYPIDGGALALSHAS